MVGEDAVSAATFTEAGQELGIDGRFAAFEVGAG